MPRKLFAFVVGFLMVAVLVPGSEATIRGVPSPYPTIQGAINSCVTGDTVLVAEGTYLENINFLGKTIVVASRFVLTGDPADIDETSITGTGGAVVTFETGEPREARLIGFTIEGGTASGIDCQGDSPTTPKPTISHCVITDNLTTGKGGGVLCEYASPRFERCIITANEAEDAGGGVCVRYQSAHPYYPEFVNCEISDNEATAGHGGGVYSYQNDIRFINCLITGNSASEDGSRGGGIYLQNSGFSTYSQIDNCTFSGNDASSGGGIYGYSADTHPRLRNCILWSNLADPGAGHEVALSTSPTITFSWCDIQDRLTGGIDADPDQIVWEGTNLSSLPSFVGADDYHLVSSSPCVDVGNPASEWNDPENPCHAGRAKPPARGAVRDDMGAYGGPWADDWYEMKLTAAPLSLNFGGVEVEEESTLSVTLGNIGTYSPIEVCDLSSSNPVFSASNAGDSLVDPDDECEIEITFAPDEDAIETGTVTIVTSDGTRWISVRGEGLGDPTGVATRSGDRLAFRLDPATPNPFNPETWIRFRLARPSASPTCLRIYNSSGEAVRSLFEGEQRAGEYVVRWDGKDAGEHPLPSGIFFAVLTSGKERAVQKLVLIR